MSNEVIISPIMDAVQTAITDNSSKRLGSTTVPMSSVAGDPRETWLKFRWCLPDKIPPFLYLLFNLGNIIEDEVVRVLRLSGFEVHNEQGGEQFGFSAVSGHYRGRVDGVIRGIPESDAWHLLEVKSMADKYFNILLKEGVEKSNPKYYGQCQVYMHHANLARCLVVVYNKNNSNLYFERIPVDPTFGPAMEQLAWDIVTATEAPASSYRDETDWRVKMKPVEWREVYWGHELPPTANCRNCVFSQPLVGENESNGTWVCHRYQTQIDSSRQKVGCTDHTFIPDLVPAQLIELHSKDAAAQYVTDAGVEFWSVPAAHAASAANAFTSQELIQLSRVGFDQFITDPIVSQLRQEMGGRVAHVDRPADANTAISDEDIPF